jgi:acyl dehydratase
MITFTSAAEIMARAGSELGVSNWHEVTQEAVDRFAEVTGDHQFIHVDPERAAQTPLGGTIAHGLYTLSLGPGLVEELVTFTGFAIALNYGYDRVRFPAPLPVGDHVRLQASLGEVTEIAGGIRVVIEQTFHARGGGKPVCVAASVAQFYG